MNQYQKSLIQEAQEKEFNDFFWRQVKIWGGGAFFVGLFLFWILNFVRIAPGYVGVVVDMLGDKKGVEAKELHVGLHWIAPYKSVYQFPIFEQNNQWENFCFQTIEGMAVSADVGITFNLKPDFIPIIFQKYRRGMADITQIFIVNYLRDAINITASKFPIEDLYSSGKEEFFRTVEQQMKNDLAPLGINISRIYLMGRFHFPEGVIKALNAKIEANQRAQQRENELREAEAEARKQLAKAEGLAKSTLLQAEAEAKSNELLAKSVTRELIDWHAVQRWDGRLSLVSSGGNIIDLSNFMDKHDRK